MSYPQQSLLELGVIQTGSTPLTAEASYWGGEFPFVTPGELDQDHPVTVTPRTLSEEGALQSRLLQADAVMICCIGSLGKIGIAGRPVVTNQQINSIQFDPQKIWPKYGYYACQRLKPRLLSMAPATTIPIVSKSKFGQLEIPVPPLVQQRRIAAILDQADALRTKRREALAQLDSLTQSIFIEMFGDPVTNSLGWPTKRLKDVAEFENGDRSSNYPSGDDILDSGVLFLSTKNIIQSRLDVTEAVFISQAKFKSLSRGKARKGDLIVTLRGTLGNCCIFDCEHETAFINAQMMLIRPGEGCSTHYLHALLTSKQAKDRFLRIGNGAAVPQLTSKQFAELDIPIPPKSLQTQFAERLQTIRRMESMQHSALTSTEALFISLQHRAFQGEL